MKKLIFFCITILLISYSIFSIDLSFSPFAGAVNVNLNAKTEWQSVRPIDNPTGESGQIFDNAQIVAHGEIRDITYSEAGEINVIVSCDSNSYEDGYFWFVSQSNPDSKRPFQLQLAGPIRYHGYEIRGNVTYHDAKKVEYAKKLENGISLSINLNNDNFYYGGGHASNYYQIDFNIGIYLPGEINNGTLTFENVDDNDSNLKGKSYTLMPGEDYSAEITVTVQVAGPTSSPQSVTYVIPFSGYYDPTLEPGQSYSEEVSSSLSVNILPAASAIDLINNQGDTLDIAEISYGIYNLKSDYVVDDDILLFLSASPNPFVGNQNGFRFIHESAIDNPNAVINSTNSLGYTITSKFNPAPGETETSTARNNGSRPSDVTYDGTSWIDISDTTGHLNSDNGAQAIETVHHSQSHKYASISNPHWHTYRGLLQLQLDSLPSSIDALQQGYYRSNIYVHVVVDENLYNFGGRT